MVNFVYSGCNLKKLNSIKCLFSFIVITHYYIIITNKKNTINPTYNLQY